MDCEQALLLISAQLDREIQPDERAQLDTHLRECPSCQATMEAFRLQHEELRLTFVERRQAAVGVAERVTAQLPAPATVPFQAPRKESRIGRRLALALGAVASLAGVALLVYFLQPKPQQPVVPGPGPDMTAGFPGRLTAKVRQTAPAALALQVGQTAQTKAGERRRSTLPDGTILYLNQNTAITLTSDRQLTLSEGEVYAEVAPKKDKDPQFTIKTPQREVKALGTKFAVRTEGEKAGVLVTQGQVEVTGYEGRVLAGQQLAPDSNAPVPAPRVTHVLDWTRELMAHAESPLVPASKYNGGALIAVDPNGQEAKLSLRKFHIDLHVEDGFARTTIDQTYFNHESSRLEGTFYFPLPPDSSLSRLAMYVDGNLMEGGMVERNYGRAVYEEIVHSQRDPALLEWLDGSTFKMRVFPLEGRQEKRIVLSYTQKLPTLYGQAQYRFPAGHNLEVVRDWSFHARVRNGAKLAWTSDSHTLKAKQDGADLLLDVREKLIEADTDVQLSLIDPEPAKDDPARFSSFEHEGARYLMLRYRPALVVNPPAQAKAEGPRNWVFLFESSADRDPLLARVQIDIIQTMLQHIEYSDTFSILTAGTRVHSFATKPQPASPANIQQAVAFLERTHLIGALDLSNALSAAELLTREPNSYLVHVGSGIPALGERGEDVLAKRIPSTVRYVGVGVGKRWSRSLMKMMAERTGGYFTQINPDEPVGWRAFELFATLNTPRLLNVSVVDAALRARFLMMNTNLCQGEELCAITRIEAGDPMPESVTVSGVLDGQVYSRTIAVKDVTGDAGYLPRTWAKLEIDRLLAEDAVKNRDRIIAMSKAMYVMTPYTSLLVLENEAMYEQFKVDRGRKDHWAMYPCPEKIKVVYEPDPLQPTDARGSVPPSDKPPVNQVLQTIVIRVPARWLTWPNQNEPFGGQQVVTAVQLFSRSRDSSRMQRWDTLRRLGEARGDLGLNAEPELAFALDLGKDWYGFAGRGADGLDLFADSEMLAAGQSSRFLPEAGTPFSRVKSRSRPQRHSLSEWGIIDGTSNNFIFSREGQLLASSGEFDERVLGRPPRRVLMDGERLEDEFLARRIPDAVFMNGSIRSINGGRLNLNLIDDSKSMLGDALVSVNETRTGSFLFGAGVNQDKTLGYFGPAFGLVIKRTGRVHTTQGVSPEMVEQLGRLIREMEGQEGSSLYGRSSFRNDRRLFTDLIAYAPGMSTSQADIQAALEAEAVSDLRSRPGHIDPAARTLIEKARTAGWKKLQIGKEKDESSFALYFDGSGRYAYERVLPLGLRERVVCDGQTLVHLYPELGIGARRNMSRFHRAALPGQIPWLLPPVEDLARGASVEAIDKQAVAISPRGAAAARDAEGKPVRYLRIEMVFAGENGSLSERRLVEMPANKPHLRETYDKAGTIKTFNAEGKEQATRELKIDDAAEPSLKPDTLKLVVLPLPLRQREHVYQAYGLAPNKSLDVDENLCLEYLEPEQALELFAAEYAVQQNERARQIYLRCFHERDGRKLGFCTLLAACGASVSSDRELLKVLQEHRDDPLASYLALEHTWWYRNGQRLLALDWGRGIGPRDSFLTRMSAFRDRWIRWQDGSASRGTAAAQRAEQERALELIRQNKTNVLGLALLTLVQDQAGSDERFHRDLAEAWRLLADGSGLAYTPKYEAARNLYRGGKRQEARAHFRELYTKALEKGLLPPIDSTFRDALLGNEKEMNLWGDLMRQSAADLIIKEKDRLAVVTLAWQCWQLGDQPLATNLLQMALDGITEEQEYLITTLTAVEFLRQTNQLAQANLLLEPFLKKVEPTNKADEKLRAGYLQQAQLWRLAGKIADQRGLTARGIECLEEALEIEYEWGPSIVNLQQVREDYGKLLSHYQMLASAVGTLKLTPPNDLLQRTVRAADRWRALDTASSTPSERAAAILHSIGDRELAWEYMTTPIANRPSESDPWLGLARSLRHDGDLDLADLAYRAAFDAEPTNAQILWDRAENLQQFGKSAEAQKLLQEIVDTKWQPRFSWIKDQAKWRLKGK